MHVKSTWRILGAIFSILRTLNNIIKLHSDKLPHHPKEIHSPLSLPLWLNIFHLNCSISRESSFVFPQCSLFSHPHFSSKSTQLEKCKSIMLCTPYPAIFCIWNLHSLAPEHTDYDFLQVYLLYSGRLSEKKLGYLSYFLRQNHMDFLSILRNVNDQGLSLNPRVTYSNLPSSLLLPSFFFLKC